VEFLLQNGEVDRVGNQSSCLYPFQTSWWIVGGGQGGCGRGVRKERDQHASQFDPNRESTNYVSELKTLNTR
jgi:hypothetical protein